MMRNVRSLFLILILSCGLSPEHKGHRILQQGVNDESVIIRVHAAKGLQIAGDVKGKEILYEIIKGEDKNGIVAAIAALIDLGEDDLSPLIADASRNKDPLIRTEAYKLVKNISGEKSREILMIGTQDEIAKIRKISYLGLMKFKEDNLIQKGLRDKDPLVRIAAAKALGLLGKANMKNFIKNELKIFNLEVWEEATISIAELGDSSFTPFIKELLYNTPWELRIAAAEALLLLDEKEGIKVLKEGLDSNDPFVRIGVVRVLADHPIPEMLEPLKKATQDEYINVSIGAIDALSKYQNKEYKPLCLKLMDAPNPLLRIAAAGAYLRS